MLFGWKFVQKPGTAGTAPATRTCSDPASLSVTVRKSYVSQPSPSGFSVTHALYSVSELSGTHSRVELADLDDVGEVVLTDLSVRSAGGVGSTRTGVCRASVQSPNSASEPVDGTHCGSPSPLAACAGTPTARHARTAAASPTGATTTLFFMVKRLRVGFVDKVASLLG